MALPPTTLPRITAQSLFLVAKGMKQGRMVLNGHKKPVPLFGGWWMHNFFSQLLSAKHIFPHLNKCFFLIGKL